VPIRFQVDGDFYDHPKTIDLSDAAVALWTRAGSYSTHKHLDGFVPDGMLARLSKSPTEASAELVRARLWRRVRGGFQFHQWDERNLTKDEIDADREYERDRKRRQRAEKKASTRAGRSADEDPTKAQRQTAEERGVPPVENPGRRRTPQLDRGSVPPGQRRDDQGTSHGNPSGSVSVSVSVSESVSRGGQAPPHAAGRDDLGPRPPDTCPEHQDDPDPPACRRCKGAREKAEAWNAAYALHEIERRRNAPQCPTHPGQPAHNCGLCRSEAIAARED